MVKKKNVNQKGEKITNWAEYNESLKNRGSIWNILDAHEVFDNWYETKRQEGQKKRYTYTDYAIEFMHIVAEIYKLPYRQTVGFLEQMIKDLDREDITIPDYTMMSIRGKKKERIDKIKSKIKYYIDNKLPFQIALDSTGYKVYGENEWKVKKHGVGKRRMWAKSHAAIDIKSRLVLAHTLTGNNVHDCEEFWPIIQEILRNSHTISRFFGDGAYHPHAIIEELEKHGIEPMIPLPKNAVLKGENKDEPVEMKRARDKLLLRQHDCCGTEAWKKATDYHYRSIVENTFSRLKTIFGERLRFKLDKVRKLRSSIRIFLLNAFTKLGLPVYG